MRVSSRDGGRFDRSATLTTSPTGQVQVGAWRPAGATADRPFCWAVGRQARTGDAPPRRGSPTMTGAGVQCVGHSTPSTTGSKEHATVALASARAAGCSTSVASVAARVVERALRLAGWGSRPRAGDVCDVVPHVEGRKLGTGVEGVWVRATRNPEAVGRRDPAHGDRPISLAIAQNCRGFPYGYQSATVRSGGGLVSRWSHAVLTKGDWLWWEGLIRGSRYG